MGIAADTWVETIGGRLRASQITPGTYVFGMDGLPTKVKSVQTYTPQQMYYVQLSDGSNLEGDSHLMFPVRTFAQRVNTAKRTSTKPRTKPHVYRYKTTEDLATTGLKHPRQPTRNQYTIDTTGPLHYGFEDHAVPPFVAGMWYGRTSNKNQYRLIDALKRFVRENTQRSKQFAIVEKKDHWEIRPSIEAMFLRDYATIPTAEFPYKYLYGNPEQRIEFLQGFFSVRYKCYKPEQDYFVVKARNQHRYKLQMLQVICESLGIKTILTQGRIIWALTFRTRLSILPIQKPVGRKFGERHRQIVKLEPVPPRPCVHLETEKPIAVSDSFVPIWHSQANKKKF